MKKYFIWTVGCQMNEADSEKLARELEGRGMTPAEEMNEADLIVLNTCAVRQAAEDKALGTLGWLKSLKRRRPDVTIAVGGCMVGADHSELARKAPHVDHFFRPVQFDDLLETVQARVVAPQPVALGLPMARAGSQPLNLSFDLKPTPFTPTLGEGCVETPDQPSSLARPNRPTRWVSIINGCNRACTYCIVPLRRGREFSRPIPELVAEVQNLVADGAREVTLLGQIVDRYGRDLPGRPDLADLFGALSEIDDLWRIRFLTSHPADMTQRIIDAVAALPKVCEHINIPVQAGDDAMLKLMKRGYRIDQYLSLIERIRSTIPNVSLATDIIVGMCGETDEQFQRTLDLLEAVRFDVVHVAMYSPRPGTPAYDLPDDIPPVVKKERLHAIERLQEQVATEINARLLHETVDVLVEAKRKEKWEGRTSTNKLVFFADEADWLGRFARVHIDRTSPWSLQGTVTGEATPPRASALALAGSPSR